MTPEIQKYIELLESQLGYSEKSGSYTKFGDWYGKNVEFDADYSAAPWCDMYLSWAAHKLGYEEWIGQFAWTVAHAEWFKEQGAWGKTPKPGAFVFYDWSGSNDIDNIDHVGVVTRVEGGRIHTIEGNIDGGVAKRKERDTSKVVGYGYPDRIKERLDAAAAAKKAKEQANQVGTLQIPEESLSSLIPRAEAGHSAQFPQGTGRIQAQNPTPEQPAARGQVEGRTPAEAQGRSGAEAADSAAEGRSDSATQPSGPRAGATPEPAATQQSPQAAASPAPGAVKKGKHAKPATADTEAATAEPLPSHTDTSATGPLPAIDSPTLIGSALVAALALLAVAKTRRLRLSPAAATAGKPARPSRAKGRRRRRGTAPVTAVAAVNTAVELREDADRLATAAALRSLGAVDAVTDTREDAASHVLDSVTASQTRHRATGRSAARHAAGRDAAARHAAGRDAAGRDAERHVTSQGAARSGGARHRKLPLETRPFDLTTDAPQHHRNTSDAASFPQDHRPGSAPFTPAFDSEPYEPDFDQSRFAFTDQTGPLERITLFDETGPLEVVLDTGPLQRLVDTGPFERILIPGATSAFDAFSPPRSRRGRRGGGDLLDSPELAAYRGRRRRAGAEEHAGHAPDVPLRGRRHRRTHAQDEQRLVGGGRHRA
ncbi:CHAP domain-containing protein [Nonomuraea gerenzanensis]|uniref:Peptidase C51 domain-containing protein n=1 Tax=Nonomuraea gerenzanensis TaxID=93944 RepID=A0A1M4E331_9ACTN|nr:CHAP domain-containing protein [Nonomuraea gerenzanensis]SBO93227.1 hypothetical protein BN4615_P2741 [Nonomuraea gerenzanensis]